MSCSCGRVQAMLLPCDHTDAVFYDMGLEIEPINIHYRWWTVHSYSRNISDSVREDIERMREKYRHFYDSNHRFLGFPLSDSQMNVIQSSYANTSIYHTNTNLPFMETIVNYNLKHGPLLKGSPTLENLMSAMNDINASNEVICSNEDDEISGNKKNSVEEHNFSLDDSGEHRTVMYKSQGHLSISTLSQSKHNDNETNVDYVTAKGLLYPLVDEFIRLGPTCNDITWFEEQIELFKIKKIAERKDKNQDSTVYLSQHNGRKRVPRYKHPREM